MPKLASLALILLTFGAPSVLAQALPQADQTAGGTFITPFPDNDTHRVQVFGESMAEGLLAGLVEAMGKEPRVAINRKHRVLTRVLRGEITDELKAIETEIEREPPHVAIVMPNMIGAFPWRDGFDRRFPPGSEARREEVERRREAWKADRGQRFDALMRAFRKKNVAVYWVGLPIMRSSITSDDAQVINAFLRERAIINGGRFIDIFASFADEGGTYSPTGPDVEGKPKVLREQDGVHLTAAGSRKLGHFIERELKRDLTQARSERVIPLAGSEDEQKRVRPPTTIPVATKAALTGAAQGQSGGAASAGPGKSAVVPAQKAVVTAPDGTTAEEIRADNTRITLKSISQLGREDSINIEILRPAIPASVFNAVTRRESADKPSQVGEPLVSDISGGQTVVSSVTQLGDGTAGAGDKRRPAGRNAPFQLVLEKGERLTPKPGRSDDMPWPRQETVPIVTPAAEALPPARPAPGRPAGKGQKGG